MSGGNSLHTSLQCTEGEMMKGQCRSMRSLQQLLRMEDGPDESQGFNGQEVEGGDQEPYVA